MNHIKRLWGHYLTLLILIAALAYPIYRVYLFFQTRFGQEAALIALTLTVMVVMILVVRGAVHTHRLIRDLKLDLANDDGIELPADRSIPIILKLFKITPSFRKKEKPEKGDAEGTLKFPPLFNISPNRHRGKPPRFPREKIRKAVLKWESRDPSITALTLEQFLAQEFGSGPDGILLMATTTFYDWRRRIL
ncbi:MAG TPA: hypothetical protein PLL95_19235, partial [Anaerolineales bacterium]|nr:hypothetical protein [Anaerolineales bacterium]